MRIRTIKPAFWKNEELASVSSDACLLAIGLLNYADDEGYFNANPALIKADIFPIRELSATIPELLSELSKHKYIELFTGSDNKNYGKVTKFVEHQYINRPTPSKIKELFLIPNNSLIPHGDVTAGRERKGKEGNKEELLKNNIKPEKDYLTEFKEFYTSYPKRRDRPNAEKAYLKARKEGFTREQILNGLLNYVKFLAIENKDIKFIPYPAKWLTACGWEDEYGSASFDSKLIPKIASKNDATNPNFFDQAYGGK